MLLVVNQRRAEKSLRAVWLAIPKPYDQSRLPVTMNLTTDFNASIANPLSVPDKNIGLSVYPRAITSPSSVVNSYANMRASLKHLVSLFAP